MWLVTHFLVLAILCDAIVGHQFGALGLARAFLAWMFIAGLLHEFPDIDSIFTDRDVGGAGVDPGSAIEIVDAVLHIVLLHRSVSMAAENTRGLAMTGVCNSAIGHFLRESLPARAQAVDKTT